MPDRAATCRITPPPRLIISGIANRDTTNAPFRLVSSVRSQSSSVISVMLPLVLTPALLTTISIPPKCLTVSSINAFICVEFPTSPGRKNAFPPALSIISTVSRPLASVFDVPATAAPSLANNTAIACPKPDPNPVTNATFPLSFIRLSYAPKRTSSYSKQVDWVTSHCYF